MFTKQGVCDWCSKMSLLARHDYIDGKYHFSCASCHDIATLDVRLFNKDELALNGRSSDSMQK